MELMIASGKAIPQLQLEHGLAVDRVYTGSFMTSLDMAGQFVLDIRGCPVLIHTCIVNSNSCLLQDSPFLL